MAETTEEPAAYEDDVDADADADDSTDEIWIFMVEALPLPRHADGDDDNDNNDDSTTTPPTNGKKRILDDAALSASKRQKRRELSDDDVDVDDIDVDNDEEAVEPTKPTAATATTTAKRQPRTDIYYSRDPINAVRQFNGLDVLSDIDLEEMVALQRRTAAATASSSLTLAQMVGWPSSSSSSSSMAATASHQTAVVTAPPVTAPKARLTRHSNRLDEALANSNGEGLGSVGAMADALSQAMPEIGQTAELASSLLGRMSPKGSAVTRLVKTPSSRHRPHKTVATADNGNGKHAGGPLALPRIQDIFYAAYTHEGTIKRTSRSRNTYYRLCMVQGPVANVKAAQALTLLWNKRSRGIMPRAVWGDAIARRFELELYGDYDAIVDRTKHPAETRRRRAPATSSSNKTKKAKTKKAT